MGFDAAQHLVNGALPLALQEGGLAGSPIARYMVAVDRLPAPVQPNTNNTFARDLARDRIGLFEKNESESCNSF